MPLAPRILAIRGGAIGDFVLTLPALKLLREGFPDCELELLGYPHILALAHGRYYAHAIRSIEGAAMARFFARDGTLDPELSAYFASFRLVISWLYDPDEIFRNNLIRAGVRHFVSINPIVNDQDHAAKQLAAPLEKLALFLDESAACLYPSPEDLAEAESLLASSHERGSPILIHPGSGSPSKNWPIENWLQLVEKLLNGGSNHIFALFGEADEEASRAFRSAYGDGTETAGIQILSGCRLPVIGALAQLTGRFVGHDSGISHIAAAVGARCYILFGPTDAAIWAPQNPTVVVLEAPNGDLRCLSVNAVYEAITSEGERP